MSTDFPVRVFKAKGVPNPEEGHAMLLDRLKRAFKIGVTVAFGSDTFYVMEGESRGSLAISYIDNFVEAGVAANLALQTITCNAARLLGVENERRSIRPGMAADIIATPENPFDNITTLKQVLFVMKDGVIIRPTGQ